MAGGQESREDRVAKALRSVRRSIVDELKWLIIAREGRQRMKPWRTALKKIDEALK